MISITIDDAISRLHNADAALQSTAIKGTSFEEANNATGILPKMKMRLKIIKLRS